MTHYDKIAKLLHDQLDAALGSNCPMTSHSAEAIRHLAESLEAIARTEAINSGGLMGGE